MSKSSTVTVRERPVEEVAIGEGRRPDDSRRNVRRPDRSAHRARRSHQPRHGIRPPVQHPRRARQPLVDAHDLLAVHQRVPDGAALRHQALSRADGRARRRVDAQQSGSLGLRSDERRLAPARAAARPQPHAAGQRRRSRAGAMAAHSDGRARRPARSIAADSDLRQSPDDRRSMPPGLALRRPSVDIEEKLDAGVRLDLEDGVRLFDVAGSAGRRLARQPRARAAPRRPHVLQLQHPARGDQRLRRELSLLLVRAAEAWRSRAPTRCRSSRRGTSCGSAPISRSPKSTSSTACTPTCRSTTTRSCCAASSGSVRTSI